MEQKTLSITELAEYLHIGRNTAYNLARKEGFPCVSIGKRLIVPIKALEEWLAEEAKKNVR